MWCRVVWCGVMTCDVHCTYVPTYVYTVDTNIPFQYIRMYIHTFLDGRRNWYMHTYVHTVPYCSLVLDLCCTYLRMYVYLGFGLLLRDTYVRLYIRTYVLICVEYDSPSPPLPSPPLPSHPLTSPNLTSPPLPSPPELAQAVVDAGAVQMLVLCLQEPEISLKRISASALSDISKHSPEVCCAIYVYIHTYVHTQCRHTFLVGGWIHYVHAYIHTCTCGCCKFMDCTVKDNAMKDPGATYVHTYVYNVM